MINGKSNLHKYEPLFGNWTICDFIGETDFSSVYKLKDPNSNYAVVKFIRIPNNHLYSNAIASCGTKKKKLDSYFLDLISNIENYINALSNINDPYILDYQDHTIVKLTDKNGWDFLIKTEYIESLSSYLNKNIFTVRDLLLLGIDLAVGLTRYRQKKIYQTNINEKNIFLCENGTYKIGDFSLTNHIIRNSWPNIFFSDPNSISPELMSNKVKNTTADIYSLGIFMYKILNNGRYPFFPKYPREISTESIRLATKTRLKGEFMPKPVNCANSLFHIILKACAYKASARYKNPMDLRNDLKSYLNSLTDEEKNKTLLFPSHDSNQNEEQLEKQIADDPDRTIAYSENYPSEKYSMYLEDEFLQEKNYSDTINMLQSHNFNLKELIKSINNLKKKIIIYFRLAYNKRKNNKYNNKN